MSISFASATGNLMNRWGKLGNVIKALLSYQSSQLTNLIDTSSGIVAQLDSEPDIQAIIGASYIDILNSTGGTVGGTLQQTAAAIANRIVYRDNPQFNQTLTDANLIASLIEIIRQMKQQGATILAQTITATPSTSSESEGGSFNGAGNGIIVASVVRPVDGLTLQNCFAETIKIECSQDSYVGGATAGNESFSVTGVGEQTDVLAFNWPLGSNCSTQLNAIDGNSDNTSGNLLTNSGFSEFTDDVPDNWDLVEGTGGTNVFQENSIVYDGSSSALRVQGVTGETFYLRQLFNDGDAGKYAFNIYMRRGGAAPATGQWTVDLVDENEVVINDEAGNPNSFNIDLTTLTIYYTGKTGIFRTPLALPNTVYLRIRETVTLEDGVSVYADKAAFGGMTQCYVSGPFLAVFSGGILFEQGDYGTCVITNSRGSGGTLSTWATLLQQLFFDTIMDNELIFPYSATPSISDGLIG
jgi:hypothetical protein